MEHMVDLMQAEIDRLRAHLLALQNGHPARIARAPKDSRRVATGKKIKNFWTNLTPEQRSAEMLRRRAVALAKKGGIRSSEGQRRIWANMTPAQKKKRVAAVAEGKRKAQAAREAAV